jgi:hypothetical protein
MMMINITKELNDVHKELLKEELKEELIDIYMENLQEKIKGSPVSGYPCILQYSLSLLFSPTKFSTNEIFLTSAKKIREGSTTYKINSKNIKTTQIKNLRRHRNN